MNSVLPFPQDRSDISCLYLSRYSVHGKIALLGPKGMKRYQKALLLAGSELALGSVRTCPANESRNTLIRYGALRREEDHLLLVKDIECSSVYEAACLTLGYSVNGWNVWKFGDEPLSSAFYRANLSFYDPATAPPPYIPGLGKVVECFPSNSQSRIGRVVSKTNIQSSITYELKAGERCEFDVTCHATCICITGSVTIDEKTLLPKTLLTLGAGRRFVVAETACELIVCHTLLKVAGKS